MKSEVKSESGVYILRNSASGDAYVGSTVNLKVRESNHRSNIKHGRLPSKLKDCVSQSGPDFDFRMLERCHPMRLLAREKYWVQKLRPCLNERKVIRPRPRAGVPSNMPKSVTIRVSDDDYSRLEKLSEEEPYQPSPTKLVQEAAFQVPGRKGECEAVEKGRCKMKSGVYVLRNRRSGDSYVGSSIDLKIRESVHQGAVPVLQQRIDALSKGAK